MLLLERGHHRHHGLDKPGPLGTLRAKAAFAPQDTRADGALRRIVRRLDAFHAHKGPQGVVDFEHLPTDAFRLGHATGLARFEPPRDLAPHRPHRDPELRVGAVSHRGRDATHETSAGPAPAGPPRSPATVLRAQSWLQSPAADAPSRLAATGWDTTCRRSSDPSPGCRRTAPPTVPARPWPHATGGPRRR